MNKRKAPSSENNPNHEFCDFLLELADYEKNVSRNIYKYNAYRKAAHTLAEHPTRIKSGEEARKLGGVGDKIGKKIDEFIQTGKLQKLEKIRTDTSSTAISELTRVSGIGPAKAKELVDGGISSIEELHKHKDKLNHHQLIGLRYFNDFERRIPRDEIQQIEKIIKREVASIDSNYQVTVCGSYRRGKAMSGDVDVLLTHPSFTSTDPPKSKRKLLENIIEVLEKKNLIIEAISMGDVKFMGVCKLFKNDDNVARRLDVRLTPYDQFHCSVLYFTGSDLFNQRMRAHALEKGFTLNEYSLRRVDAAGVPAEPLKITSEKDIFDRIHFPYKRPEERD